MSSTLRDPIPVLLSDTSEERLDRARKVCTFLRLLVDDARPECAMSVDTDLKRARHDLERERVRRVAAALEDLIRLHLQRSTARDSFSWFGDPAIDLQSAWRSLDEQRDEWSWLPGVPEPGESAIAVAERLHGAWTRLQDSPGRLALWHARIVLLRDGLEAGEAALRGLFRGSGAKGHERDALIEGFAICGVAECLLDRGAVREAREWLRRHRSLFCESSRQARLLSFATALSGELDEARRLAPKSAAQGGPLTEPLIALRDVANEWLRALPGAAPAKRPALRSRPNLVRRTERRADLGACVFAVFALRPGGDATPVHLDVAPALRDVLDEWTSEREDACTQTNDPTHRLIVEARPIVTHGARLRGALGVEFTRALALVPLLDDQLEVCGWVHIECEHHLLPSIAGLNEIGESWRDDVLRHRDLSSPRDLGHAPGSAESSSLISVRGARVAFQRRSRPSSAAAFAELAETLGMKMRTRRWWGFDVEERKPVLVAEGGEGLSGDRAPGGARALMRALTAGGLVSFDEGDERLSMHAEAASGVVLPIRARGGLIGLFAIESARKRDFKPEDLEPKLAASIAFGHRLRLAQFSSWHEDRYGFGVHFDCGRRDFRSALDHLWAAARSTGPVVFAGPAGAGKRLLARWLHFESGRRTSRLASFACGVDSSRASLARAFESASAGTLVLDDVERLEPALQDELVGRLEERRGGGNTSRARILATTRRELTDLADPGALRDDLTELLGGLHFDVAGLGERREEIPALIEYLVHRIAGEESIAAPTLDDEAIACLWRQEWAGNVRELEGVLYKLCVLFPGEVISARALEETARRYGIRLRARLGSRRPQRRDMESAIWTTQTAGGRVNKTRASLYLGWDPDTLVARMGDLGVENQVTEVAAWGAKRS